MNFDDHIPGARHDEPKGIEVRPGDRLVIRGYSGNVLEKNVVYKRSYWINGVQFINYESDGISKAVDARRVEAAEESACVQFSERLAEALDILGEIGANYCGDLTEAQAKRFYKATNWLAKLAHEVM